MKYNENEIAGQIKAAAMDSGQVLVSSAARLGADIARAASMIAEAIKAGGRVLACGNGGSAADAQHLAGELVGRFLMERGAYSAISLSTDTSVMTSLANDYGYDAIFARQVTGHGREGDVLVAISTSGNSKNVINAIEAARAAKMKVVGLTGQGGGAMLELCDVLLDADSPHTPRVQEVHGFIIHEICEIVEKLLN